MITSVRWLNRYLQPATLTADEAEAKLIAHSFPIESREEKQSAEGSDSVLDVEVTSNRGDCLCHLGLARELAATTGRKLVTPAGAPKAGGGPVASITSVENRVPDVCPRFTARVIKGVKVGPSPQWLVSALESVGQRSINNIVDVSNFVLLETGHPSHTFDLNTLKGKRLIVRYANEGEPLTALDKRAHKLKSTDLVVADAERAVSLAGVIGGLETGVTDKTTDVLLEMATWDPVTIRRAARRLEIRTDAGYRFERIVDARDIDWASERAAALILEVAGGTLCDGVIDVGSPDAKARKHVINLRIARCAHILGKEIALAEIMKLLAAIGIEAVLLPPANGDAKILACAVPHHRPDLLREIDLIEEVARLHGLDQFKVSSTIAFRTDSNQPEAWSKREKAMREVSSVLTAMGYFETVTFSFTTREYAAMFMPQGLRAIKVDEARRPGTPYLRPSIIPSLLTCRRVNQDGQAQPASGGGVRLFEQASVFGETDDGKAFGRATREQRHLGVVIDAGSDHESAQRAIRLVRGTFERLAATLGGAKASIELKPMPALFPAIDSDSCAGILINGQHAGYLGLISAEAQRLWGLDERVCVGEVCLSMLIDLYPPAAKAHLLPAFPGIERDLSVVVDEAVAWANIEATLAVLKLEKLEQREFVGVYRGKQVGPGKKSVTLRLKFRDDSRTLRHEEVDPQIGQAVAALKQKLGAELRA